MGLNRRNKSRVYKRRPTRKRSNWRTYAGAMSGAALGYIHGNVPGAIAGGKLGWKLGSRSKAVVKRAAKRRRIQRSITAPKSHADMSLVKFSLPGRKRLRKLDRNSKITYTDTYSSMFEVASGVQGVHSLRYNMHRNQLFTNPNITINDKRGYNINLFDLNVDKSLSGSTAENNTTVLPGQIGGIDQDAFYLANHHCSMSLTSFTNVPAHIELYYLLCKKDNDIPPESTWGQEAWYMGNPQATWAPPANQIGTGVVAGAPTEVLYGQDPTFNPVFKKYWKILKKQEFILQAGNTLRMEFKRPINRLIRKYEFMLKDEILEYYQGLTFVPMIVVKPAPVAMRLTSGETTFAVNTAAYKFGVMFTDTTTIYPVPAVRLAINRAFSTNMVRTFAELKQEFIDDEDQEQDVDVAGDG